MNLLGFDRDRPPLKAGEALELLRRSLGLGASEIPLTDQAQARVPDPAGRPAPARPAGQRRVGGAGTPVAPGSPSCCVLVTSRNRLGDLVARDGAHALPLDLASAKTRRRSTS
ncbi:hypothetical protein [Streptomyces regalis]|uniref:hypothetical protein n=1 Tax=Streptomyces regalis TaxID=68262 RepID=UPI00131C117A|nr:hypothetical protein [Streptomyces regalis]